MQLAPSRWDAPLEWLPSQEPENPSRLCSKGSRRSYQLASPPLPLTQFNTQGSDLIFFFSPTLPGSWFSLPVLAEPLSPLDAAEGAPEGEGTAGRRGHPAPTAASAESAQVGAESTCLGLRCRVRGHAGFLGSSRNPERSLGHAPAPSRPGLSCTCTLSLLASYVFSLPLGKD